MAKCPKGNGDVPAPRQEVAGWRRCELRLRLTQQYRTVFPKTLFRVSRSPSLLVSWQKRTMRERVCLTNTG